MNLSTFRFKKFHKFRVIVYLSIWVTLFSLCVQRAAFSVAVTGLVIRANPSNETIPNAGDSNNQPVSNENCPDRSKKKADNVEKMSVKYSWTQIQQEVAIFTFNLGYMAGHIPGAFIVIKFGSHRVMTFVLCACTALVFSSVISAHTYWLFVSLRTVIGFLSGCMYQIVSHSVSVYSPARERSIVLLFVHTANILACAVIFPVGGYFIEYYIDGWKLTYLLSGLFGMFSMIIWTICVHSDPDENFIMSEKEKKHIRDSLYPHGKPKTVTVSSIPYRQILTDKQLYIFFFVHYSNLQILFATLLGVVKYFSDFFNVSSFQAGLYGIIPFICESMLQLGYSYISALFFKKNTTRIQQRKINTLIGSVGCSTFLFFAGFVNCKNLATGVVIQTLSLMFHAPFQAGYLVGIVDRYGPLIGFTYSIINVFGSLAGLLQRIIIIILLKYFSYRPAIQWSFIITSIISVLFSIPFVLFGDDTPIHWRREDAKTSNKFITKIDIINDENNT